VDAGEQAGRIRPALLCPSDLTRRITFSSPTRAEDSFYKTAMSRREDIVSCIDSRGEIA
jgi:hypothetical protein